MLTTKDENNHDHITMQKSEGESHSVVSDSLRPHGLSSWNSPGQNTGVGILSLLQGIFPTQGSNPGLPHCRQVPYQLSHKGSPRILEWVAYLFSSRSFWPKICTRASCITDRFFTNWAMRAWCRKSIWQNLTTIHYKNCQKTNHKSEFP